MGKVWRWGSRGYLEMLLCDQYRDGDSFIKVTIGNYIILYDTGDREYLQTVVDNDIQIKATFEKCQSENQGDEFDFSLSCEIKTLNQCIFSETALLSTLQNSATVADNGDNI